MCIIQVNRSANRKPNYKPATWFLATEGDANKSCQFYPVLYWNGLTEGHVGGRNQYRLSKSI